MRQLCVHRDKKHLGSLENTMPRATFTYLSCSPNFLRASYHDECTLMHESIIVVVNFLKHFLPQAHKSTGLPYGSFFSTSGERYPGVPAKPKTEILNTQFIHVIIIVTISRACCLFGSRLRLIYDSKVFILNCYCSRK